MDAVLTALAEDRIGPGEQSKNLVQIAKENVSFDYCLSLRSPAIALYYALAALNLEDGAGVLLSALSPRYYEKVVKDLRLTPLFCDIGEASPCISVETVQAALNRAIEAHCQPAALLVDHTLGYVPEMEPITGLGLPIIEDCSRSFGAVLPEPGLGGSGVFAILGLEEADMLTAGGGALLFAKNRRDASVLRSFDVLPEFALPDMNAAMAVVQMKESAKNLEKRRTVAEAYLRSSLRTRHTRFAQPWGEYNNYAFALVLETGMKEVKAYAKKKDIAVESAFENTIAGSWAEAEDLRAQCPQAWSLSLRTALFPLYPRLSAAEIERVAKLILTLP
jgi:dTDP-4-amino-4,6-dideoxygalactose transaminase